MMTTQTVATRALPQRLAPVMAILMGLGLVTLAGHVQANALHDAAHDVRHATGFPCH